MNLNETYDRLLSLNGEAFAAAQFEVAYHILEAALHCAEGLGDEKRLSAVQRLAEEQGAWIDAHAPQHRLSSRSAQARGNPSVFHSCARIAAAMLAGLHAARSDQRILDTARALLGGQPVAAPER